jgi:hypothetical protein
MLLLGIYGIKRLRKHLTTETSGLLAAGVLLLLAVPAGAAVPLFCIDLSDLPSQALTGCGNERTSGDSLAWPPFAPAIIDPVAQSGAVLSRPPAGDRSLVRVGRKALAEAPGSKGRQRAAADFKSEMSPRDASQSLAPETASGLREPQDDWIFLHLHQDGTYLFLGASANIHAQIPFAVDDDLLPDGIGIGKKWPF